MKKFLLLLLLISCYIFGSSQKNERRIYVLDGTGSMKGYGGAPNIWSEVKTKLLTNISDINEDKSDIILIVFSSGIDYTIFGKGKILNFIKDFTPNGGYTNIVAGWDKAVSLINPSQYNFITLLTDGKQNVNTPETLESKFMSWGKISVNSNAFACIVRLTKDAEDQKIANVINSSKNIKYIDGIRFPSFIQIQNSDVEFNLKGGYDKKTIQLFLNLVNEGDLPNDSNIQLELINTSAIRLNNPSATLKKGKGSIDIEFLKLQTSMDKELDTFQLNLSSTNSDVVLVNNVITGFIMDIAEPELTVSLNTDFGKINQYNKFLFWKGLNEKAEQEITLDWNEDAILKESTAELIIKFGKDSDPKYTLFSDDKLVSGDKISVNSSLKSFKLSVQLDEKSESGKYDGVVYIKGSNSLNSNLDNQVPVKIKYSKGWNPVTTIFFWILIVILCFLILWFLFFKRLVYPVFPAITITVSDPYYKSFRLRNARKIIFSSRKNEQSTFSKIFKGKIIYDINEAWSSAWVIVPKSKKSIKPQVNNNYNVEPFAVQLERFQQYKLKNNSSNQIIELNIN